MSLKSEVGFFGSVYCDVYNALLDGGNYALIFLNIGLINRYLLKPSTTKPKTERRP
jgi:hypothetical protein